MKGISFLQAGSGKDVLFLHGYLATKESFYPQIKYFSKFYRVTAFDFPPFGGSAPLTKAYSLDDYCDLTEQVMRELHLEFPHVVAHSFGGRVAIKCLSRRTVFDRAVLCGCAGIVPKRTLSYRARVKAYRVVKKIAPKFAEKKFGSAEYRTLSPIERESYKKIVNEDLRGCAERITRPVLFLNGEKDRATPPEQVRILHEAVGGSQMKIFKGCGHFVQLDDALKVNLAIEEFLR